MKSNVKVGLWSRICLVGNHLPDSHKFNHISKQIAYTSSFINQELINDCVVTK